jgi:hypothetical protein
MYVSSESEIRSTTECLESSSWWSTSQLVASTRPSCVPMEVSNSKIGHVLKSQSGSSRRPHLVGGSDFYEVKGDNKDELVAKTTANTFARNSF